MSALVKRRARAEIDVGYITEATKDFRLLPKLRALAISALPVELARTMDRWRTRFHERRRAVVARLRALLRRSSRLGSPTVGSPTESDLGRDSRTSRGPSSRR